VSKRARRRKTKHRCSCTRGNNRKGKEGPAIGRPLTPGFGETGAHWKTQNTGQPPSVPISQMVQLSAQLGKEGKIFSMGGPCSQIQSIRFKEEGVTKRGLVEQYFSQKPEKRERIHKLGRKEASTGSNPSREGKWKGQKGNYSVPRLRRIRRSDPRFHGDREWMLSISQRKKEREEKISPKSGEAWRGSRE